MSEVGSIYSAVYSGVPVFEMIVNGIAVMRRRTDSYMNATQILKVANIDKGKRTKILEKEVLIGEHEKVQGGYGKYQGTWIPFNKSKDLAEKYQVFEQIAPMFDFNLDNMAVKEGEESLLTKEQAMVARKKLALQSIHVQQQEQMQQRLRCSVDSEPSRKKLKTINTLEVDTKEESLSERYKSVLMSIYLGDNPEQTLELLTTLQGGNLNLDMVIDEQGNTALHWATALARINTMEMLVSKGANIACTNYFGETAFMKGVMVINNFDNKCFERVVDLLKESITMVDNKKRTLLHYATLTAGVHGRMDAAIYYMKILVDYVQQRQLNSLIDSQDSLGDTCLNIATKMDCQPLVGILLEAGANNNDHDIEQANTLKKTHKPSQRGKEIVSTVQKIVDALDEEYGTQLQSKEDELEKVQSELDLVMKELETTRKDLEKKQAQSQKLSEAQHMSRNISLALQHGWEELKQVMSRSGKKIPKIEDIAELDGDEDIDALFNTISPATTQEEKKKLAHQIQAKVKAYTANNLSLEREIKALDDQYMEKEIQCKRLIAACCNLPIDRIDDLVEPLTLAIESDPPDLDLARVIGFMDKIRRQGAFTDSSNNILHSPQIE